MLAILGQVPHVHLVQLEPINPILVIMFVVNVKWGLTVLLLDGVSVSIARSVVVQVHKPILVQQALLVILLFVLVMLAILGQEPHVHLVQLEPINQTLVIMFVANVKWGLTVLLLDGVAAAIARSAVMQVHKQTLVQLGLPVILLPVLVMLAIQEQVPLAQLVQLVTTNQILVVTLVANVEQDLMVLLLG
jgi:hypothetical protein